MQHSENRKIWLRRVDQSVTSGGDKWVVLVDPSRVGADQGTYGGCKGPRSGFNGKNLRAWSINWGFVRYCVDARCVISTQTARPSLLLNCTIDLKGWAFSYATDLPTSEINRYNALITVSHMHYAPASLMLPNRIMEAELLTTVRTPTLSLWQSMKRRKGLW